MSPDIWPNDGVNASYDISPSPPWVASLLDAISSSYQLWYEALTPTSRILFFSAFLSSSVIGTRRLCYRCRRGDNMARTMTALLAAHVLGYLALVQSQTATTTTAGTQFTVPASADEGQLLLPNIVDPLAVDAQDVCPGYMASNVVETTNGITADLTLAGAACDVYGNEIHDLTLTVEYQATDRLHVEIQPRYIGQENQTWFILPEEILPKPTVDTEGCVSDSDLDFAWSNDPSFSFKVTRNSTADVLFSTEGTQLVYEDQFIEFKTALPENYNLYGLGEVIHGLRLGNNLTSEYMHRYWFTIKELTSRQEPFLQRMLVTTLMPTSMDIIPFTMIRGTLRKMIMESCLTLQM